MKDFLIGQTKQQGTVAGVPTWPVRLEGRSLPPTVAPEADRLEGTEVPYCGLEAECFICDANESQYCSHPLSSAAGVRWVFSAT